MAAEREATDRYLAIYMADRVGAVFDARIAGVTRAGLFVRLAENGADGFIPAARLSDEYWIHDDTSAALVAQRSGQRYELGMNVQVKLMEATPLTGGLLFSMQSPPRARRTTSRCLSGNSGISATGATARAQAPHRWRRPPTEHPPLDEGGGETKLREEQEAQEQMSTQPLTEPLACQLNPMTKRARSAIMIPPRWQPRKLPRNRSRSASMISSGPKTALIPGRQPRRSPRRRDADPLPLHADWPAHPDGLPL